MHSLCSGEWRVFANHQKYLSVTWNDGLFPLSGHNGPWKRNWPAPRGPGSGGGGEGGDWPLGRSREASPQFTANMHFSRARAQLGLVRSKSLAVTSLNLKKKKKRKKKQQPSQLNGTVARDSPRPESFMSYHEQADASSEETE